MSYEAAYQLAQKTNIMINDLNGCQSILIDVWPHERGSDEDLAFKTVIDYLEKKKEQLRNGEGL